MATEIRQLYRSHNGDRWYLARETDSGRVYVKHQANEASGGRVTEIGIGDFLSSGGHGPEHAELLRRFVEALEDRPDA